MLTRDLLRYKTSAGKITPKFIDPSDPVLRHFACDLVETFRASLHAPKHEIEQSLSPLLNSIPDRKLAAGLFKIYDDRCVYSGNSEFDWPAMRRTLFARSSVMLGSCKEGDPFSDFRNDVFAAAGESVIPLAENIYADLPEFELLMQTCDLTPAFLLEKYNTILVQSLVLHADSIKVRIEEPDSAKMRRFFKYLRFFRLLAESLECSQWSGNAPGLVELQIDGPASILDQSAKYGLQLASFLPALFCMSKWKFSCVLDLNGEKKLKLDQGSGLTAQFGRFGIHIPEEVKMFVKLFPERIPDWKIVPESPFLRGHRRQEFVFPDMMFRKEGKTAYLELFHRWHIRQLEDRLKFLRENPMIPLILGVESSALKSAPSLKTSLEQHELCGKRIFLFRDFPSIEKIRKILTGME